MTQVKLHDSEKRIKNRKVTTPTVETKMFILNSLTT